MISVIPYKEWNLTGNLLDYIMIITFVVSKWTDFGAGVCNYGYVPLSHLGNIVTRTGKTTSFHNFLREDGQTDYTSILCKEWEMATASMGQLI